MDRSIGEQELLISPFWALDGIQELSLRVRSLCAWFDDYSFVVLCIILSIQWQFNSQNLCRVDLVFLVWNRSRSMYSLIHFGSTSSGEMSLRISICSNFPWGLLLRVRFQSVGRCGFHGLVFVWTRVSLGILSRWELLDLVQTSPPMGFGQLSRGRYCYAQSLNWVTPSSQLSWFSSQ